jgi:hypothetical protein
MKSLTRITSKLLKLLLVALFLALAPAALASNTWYVDGVNGNDSNDCMSSATACKTIGHAISLATSGDTIMVAPATYTENLNINFSLKIIGSGAATTIVDGGGNGTVVSTVYPYAPNVRLSKLTIRNGYTQYCGGGINNADGTLTINDSTISGNVTTSCGCGGGISNRATLTVNQSTITANSAYYCGGGIWNAGTLTINRSTVSGNSVGRTGGGINDYGAATINNSTISGNSASGGGGGVYVNVGTAMINNSTISGNSAGDGGGIRNDGSVILQNSIVARNSGGDCHGTMTSKGYNVSSDYTCHFSGPGDMNKTRPLLGKLGSHGGSTQTIPLLPGSPAIDAGNPNGCTDGAGNLLKTDQRGKPRPDPEDTSGCDIGAYERQKE